MVKPLRWLILFALTSLALAQSPLPTQKLVTGNLVLPPGTPASNTSVRFQLTYCGGNNGRVNNPDGSVTIVSYLPWDLRTSTGNWSTPLYGSDQIICGTQQGTSRWRITPIYNGMQGPSLEYQINSCAADGFPNGGAACTPFDVDSAPQCGSPAGGGPVISTNCVVEYPYVVPPPPPIVGPPGPPGPSGANPGTHPQIAFYAADGSQVSGDTRFTDDGSTLSYLGTEYMSGNGIVDNILYVAGAYYFDTLPSANPMSPAPSGRSSMGINTDGNFYISSNGGPPTKICTAGDTACGTGGANLGQQNQIAYYATTGTLVSGNADFTNDGTTLSYLGNGYVQGTDTVDSILYVNGAYYMDTTPTTGAMTAAPTGRSAMGVSSDGNFYISANSGAPSEICTAGNGVCGAGGGANPGTTGQIAYYAANGTLVSGDSNLTDSGGTLSYQGNGYLSGNDTIDSLLMVKGAWYLDTLPPTSAVTAAPSGRSSFAVNTDGNFYISANAGPPSEVCTAGNAACGYQTTAGCYPVIGGNPVATGIAAGTVGVTSVSITADISATATLMNARKYTYGTTASPNQVVGVWCGSNGNNSVDFPLAAFSRLSFRLALVNLTGARYYWGLGTWGGSGSTLGTNNVGFSSTGSTKYSTDSPNSGTIGFRYSATTDGTTFKAVTVNPGVGFTVAETGVTADTNEHLFEVFPSSTGTTMNFYIDKVFVTSISTNLPNPTPPSVFDSMADMFFWGDNKNTATAVGLTFYSMEISAKYP